MIKKVSRCFLYLILFLIGINLRKCETVVSVYSFLIVYCPVKYKTQKICDEAVDDCLAALKFIPDRFVTSRTIKKFLNALYADGNIPCFNKYSGNAILFCCNKMGIIDIDLVNINLDNTNYDKDDP